MKMKHRIDDAIARAFRNENHVTLPLLFRELGFLHHSHYVKWLNQGDNTLLDAIQCGEAKLMAVFRTYRQLIQSGVYPVCKAAFLVATARGAVERLPVQDERGDLYELFKTALLSPDLTDRKRGNLEKKLMTPPDIKVFIITGDETHCHDCNATLETGAFIYLEGGNTYCLHCADLDQLKFLPSGNAALSRRAKKHSEVSALVLEFNRRYKRYERAGILVEPEAIELAEAENRGDAAQRAVQRERSAQQRQEEDKVLCAQMSRRIAVLYPGCPASEAKDIAGHAAVRGSGRVGRSAAGRALDDEALTLAVIAHVRHTHTPYDTLLLQGVPRREARRQITPALNQALARWQNKA